MPFLRASAESRGKGMRQIRSTSRKGERLGSSWKKVSHGRESCTVQKGREIRKQRDEWRTPEREVLSIPERRAGCILYCRWQLLSHMYHVWSDNHRHLPREPGRLPGLWSWRKADSPKRYYQLQEKQGSQSSKLKILTICSLSKI